MVLFVRIIVVTYLLLFGLGRAYAEEQRDTSRVIQLGALIGGGVVGWFGKDSNGSLPGEDRVNKAGLSAGILVTFNLTKLFSLRQGPVQVKIQPHLLYSTRGAGIEFNGEDRGSINMSYLKAGFVFRADYVVSGRLTPYVILGPEVGALRSAELDNGIGAPTNIEDNFKSTDLGLLAGLGTMFEVPPYGAVGLELRGDLGLVSIDGQGDGDEIRNAALTLLLAYLY
jgi:opacity protein-like surface antigen